MRRIGLMVSATALALAMAPVAELAVPGNAGVAMAKGGGDHGGGNGGDHGGGKGGDHGGGKGGDHGGNKGGKGSDHSSRSGKSGNGQGKSDRGASKVSDKSKSAKAETRGKPVATDDVTRVKADKATGFANGSSLKGLNAAHASLIAMANASPNSRVGRIASYREALLDYRAALDDPEYLEAQHAYAETLADFAMDATPIEVSDTLAALEALDDGDAIYDEADVRDVLADLNPDATEDEISAALDAMDGVVESDNALKEQEVEVHDLYDNAAAPGVPPEEGTEAYDKFHDLLRLDEPLPEPTTEETGVVEQEFIDEVDEIEEETAQTE